MLVNKLKVCVHGTSELFMLFGILSLAKEAYLHVFFFFIFVGRVWMSISYNFTNKLVLILISLLSLFFLSEEQVNEELEQCFCKSVGVLV